MKPTQGQNAANADQTAPGSPAAARGNEDILAYEGARVFEGAPSFSLANRIRRGCWGLAWLLLARWTPPPLHKWRAVLLRLFGARLGKGVVVHGSVSIWDPRNLDMAQRSSLGPRVICYNMAKVSIGEFAVISQGAHLCAGTHTIDDSSFQLTSKPIGIDRLAWVAADAFVGPGVSIGEGAVLGARGVATRDIPAWTVWAGNPARHLRQRPQFSEYGA
jgi:putative colanic acid biosynthesis acetyltransferase WcaF